MDTTKAKFFAIWKQYCKEARVDSSDSNDVRKAFISLYYPEKNSLTQCTNAEIEYLIHKIREVIEPKDMPKESYQDGQQMRRKIIAILCELYNFRKEKNGKIVPDMVKINEFLKKKTAYKCDLNSLTIEQLPKVVSQIDKLRQNEQASRRKKMEVQDGNKPF